MGELIYVDFKTRNKKKTIRIPEDEYNLKERIERVHGSLERIKKLVKDLREGNGVDNIPDEDVDAVLNETFDRR